MRYGSIALAAAAVLGGCRIDPPAAGEYVGASSGSESSGASAVGSSTIDSSGDSGHDVGSGSGGSSSDDGAVLTSGVEPTGTTGMSSFDETTATTSSFDETTTTTGEESSTDTSGECGDGVLNSPEVCDDGVNDGSYGGCARGCGSLGPHCGDGALNWSRGMR